MQILWGKPCTKTVSSIWKNMCQVWEDGPLQKVFRSKRDHTVHEVEVEVMPDLQEEEIETVSIISLCLNRNHSLITAHLKMQVGKKHNRSPIQIYRALIRLIYRGTTLKDILPNLNNMQYMSIIDANSGYHNLKLDKQLSYLTTFACPFGR